MRAETRSRDDVVFVNDSQRAEAHISRVIVAIERESVMAVEPVNFRFAAFVCVSGRDHSFIPSKIVFSSFVVCDSTWAIPSELSSKGKQNRRDVENLRSFRRYREDFHPRSP